MEEEGAPVVKSSNTGSGRASTPQTIRADGTVTRFRSPLEGFRRSLTPANVAAAPVTTAALPATKYHSRRKQRRWNNDHFFGMNISKDSTPEELIESLKISVNWRSNFATLINTPELEDALCYFTSGMGIQGAEPVPAERKALSDEEVLKLMFQRVEKRLRKIVLGAISNPSLCELLDAFDTLVKFWIESLEPLQDPLPPALLRALTGPLQVCAQGRKLSVPLSKSPFHRLLLHATCQFYGVHAESEDSKHGRTLLIKLPESETKFAYTIPSFSLFLRKLVSSTDGNQNIQLTQEHDFEVCYS